MSWLFLGYAVIMAAIFLYIQGLHRRQAALEREVELLRAAAEEGRAPEG